MKLVETAIPGAFFIELTLHQDARGAFARTFCREVFAEADLDFTPVQCNISRNPTEGTLRGMHYQRAPHGEAKLVQCVRGRVFDVAVDLRPESPAFGDHIALELDAEGDRLLYIPPGCAHGFLTLEPDSDLFYYMGSAFVDGAGSGLRWNDPRLAIAWPAAPKLISERDAAYPDFGWETSDAV